MNIETFQLAAFVALLLVGSWLFARVLKPRGRFPLRLATALAAAVLIAVVAHRLGFSLYPPLSDDMSFVSASASFAIVLTLLTLAVTFVWEAPPGTAVFCSSSAYLMQSIAMGLDRLVHFSGIMPVSPEEFSSEAAAVPMADIVSLVISALVVYALTYLLLARRLERQSLLEVGNPVMAFAVGLSMLVTIILDLAIKDIAVFDVPFRYLMVLAGSYLAVCAFILVAEFEVIYSQRLRENVATMERTLAEQGRQYELSRDTISAVNRRVHDIRHQVAGILSEGGGQSPDRDRLQQIVREVDVYDSAVRTGNAALDVVLTEKSLLCKNHGVTLACIADGAAVAGLSPTDLYMLFGNALDYALGISKGVGDAERRSISLGVREQLGMALVNLEFYAGEGLLVEDGLPTDGGLAFEALRAVTERHGGTLTCTMAGDIMHLDILLPLE